VRTLRGRLAAAIAVVALVSVAVALGIGAVLTRRAVEHNTLKDVSAQADLIAKRESSSVIACSRSSLRALEPILARQDERVVCDLLRVPTRYLTPEQHRRVRRGQPVNGTVTVEGTRYFIAARRVSPPAQQFILLRPTRTAASSWIPHLEGLVLGALVAGLLAAVAAWGLARAISRPVLRVAAASRRLVTEESPPTVPVEGPAELRSLATSFNEMASQLARARAAERDFLLSVSHELKTPLTAIRGYAEGLGDQAVSLDEAAETIRREAERLERLVTDLLDLARMRRSTFSVRREPIDLAVAAREVVRRYGPQADSFGVELDEASPNAAPALGDADRILQVLSNLVENALRVTPSGGRVHVVAEPGLLAVEDTGPGLTPDEIEHAFERFFLHSRHRDRRSVGSGLGLAIVKELTQGMGGHVAVTSAPGEGARFVVRLAVPSEADLVRAGDAVLRG
jgi:two-component system sensor histidine kinase BaeS